MSSRDTAAEVANPAKRRKLNSERAQKIAAAKYQGRYIHNIEALIEMVSEQILEGELSDICCLCFEPKALVALESACGKCPNKMCLECLTRWYHGWCLDCYRVQRAVPRECLRETVPNITQFRCEECVEKRRAEEAAKQQLGEADFVQRNSKKCP